MIEPASGYREGRQTEADVLHRHDGDVIQGCPSRDTAEQEFRLRAVTAGIEVGRIDAIASIRVSAQPVNRIRIGNIDIAW